MSRLFLLFYVLASAIHLVCCYNLNLKGRRLTKPILMPILLLFVLFSTPTPSITLLAAIIFGFLGDVFLLSDNSNKFFILGLISFLIGHIFLIISLYNKISSYPILYIVIITTILVFISTTTYISLYSHLNKMKFPVLVYFMVIATMVFYSALFLINNNGIKGILAFTGSLFFILSDYILARSIFVKSFKLKNFLVMLTYLIAELLLTLSLI